MARFSGEVRWFNKVKGYGFLGREDGHDVFMHYSSFQLAGYKSLKYGEPVELDGIQGDKGPQADNVVRSSRARREGRGITLQALPTRELL
jgi:CspA family cold shock protein